MALNALYADGMMFVITLLKKQSGDILFFADHVTPGQLGQFTSLSPNAMSD